MIVASELALSLRNDPAEVASLAARVDEFCAAHAVSPTLTAQLNLALDEAISNIIAYGYDDDGEHAIAVRIAVAHGALIAELVDDGREFDPRQALPPDLAAPLDERPVGGLGIHLVRHLMDEVLYRREGGRNHLVLTKSIT
jgi:serine/threonine-protein kinase RsbW